VTAAALQFFKVSMAACLPHAWRLPACHQR
jgi:hypothetical protein